MKFITLTKSSEDIIKVNMSLVKSMRSLKVHCDGTYRTETRLSFVGDNTSFIDVKETFEEIDELLKK